MLRPLKVNLPGLDSRESLDEVAEPSIQRARAQLAFHRHDGLAPLRDDQVHFAPIHITKVTKVEVASLNVILKVHPLEQMTCDEVFKSWPGLSHKGPIKVIVLLFFLYGTELRGSEGRQPEDGIKPLKDIKPARHGWM